MHPIHPIVVHFPIGLLCASVAFDALASRWPTGGFRDTSLYQAAEKLSLRSNPAVFLRVA